MEYFTNCVVSTGREIEAMIDQAVELSIDEFLQVVGMSETELDKLFDSCYPTLRNDYAVSFYQSVYNGVACAYVVHSGIEHIFI